MKARRLTCTRPVEHSHAVVMDVVVVEVVVVVVMNVVVSFDCSW